MSELDLTAYQGYWVALLKEQVVGFGRTPEDALALARRNRSKDRFVVRFVEQSGGTPLPIPPLLERLRPFLLNQSQPIYLVGGAVRDMLLGRPVHDLDFAVPYDGIKLAFKVGDKFGWPAYVLDGERDNGRVVLTDQNTTLDFARFRGATLEEDLRDRDFTINAMALPATARSKENIIDPTGGLEALSEKKLEMVRWESPTSLENDPVRALRAIRIAHSLDLKLYDERWQPQFNAISFGETSAERLRDEFLNVLTLDKPAETILHLSETALLEKISPKLKAGFASCRTETAVVNGQAYTLAVLANLQTTVEKLPSHHKSVERYLAQEVDGGVDGRLLLRLAALFHWGGHTIIENEEQPCHPPGYEAAGAKVAGAWLREFAFSNQAITKIEQIIRHQNQLFNLVESHSQNPIGRRQIYRYFRDTQDVGIEVAILTLAIALAHSDNKIDSDLLQTTSSLFEAYFEQYDEVIGPQVVVDGRDLMQHLNLPPGPEIGRLLRLIKEETAVGTITTKEEALTFARRAAH